MEFKKFFYTMLAQSSGLFTGFLTSILTAHVLGVAGRGEYFFIITLVMIIVQFSQFGLASSNTYLVSRDVTLFKTLFVNTIWIACVVGLSGALIVLLYFELTHSTFPKGSWILPILVPCTIFYLLGGNLLVGIQRISTFNHLQIFSGWLICLLMICAGTMGMSINGFLSMMLAGWVSISIILLLCLIKNQKKFIWSFNVSCFLQGAKYGAKAYITTLLGMLILKSNVLMLKFYSTQATLGYYSVASQFCDCLIILPSSIGMVIFPQLIRNNLSRWEETLKSLCLVSVLMIISCFVAVLCSKFLIRALFGDQFLPSVLIFWSMVPGVFFLSIITILSQYLAALGFPKRLVIMWFIAFLVMVFLSSFLIPKLSGIGAGISFSVTYTMLLLMMIRFVYQYNKKGS